MEQVQSRGVWLRLCWRRREAGRLQAELRRAQPTDSGRARCARGVRAWRPAGGPRAPSVRSRLCPRASPAGSPPPALGAHLPPILAYITRAGALPPPLGPRRSWAAPSTPPRRAPPRPRAPRRSEVTLPGRPAAAAPTPGRGRERSEVGGRKAPRYPTRSLRPHLPPLLAASPSAASPAPPCLCAFGTEEGTRRAVRARRAAELRLFLLLGERRGGRLAPPGLPKWGQSSRSPSRQLEGRGTEGPPNSSSASPLHPLLAPALGESGVWLSVIIISSGCFVGARIRRLPSGALRSWRVSPSGSARHTSVDDEERSAGDSGPLRTGTGIRAADARATCPGPAQCQRHRLGRSR